MGSISNNKNDGTTIAVTDNGNYIIDCFFPAPITNVKQAAADLLGMPGVLEHGIFTGVAHAVIVAGASGIRVAGAGGEAPWWGK